MSRIKPEEIEVGIRGDRITITGSSPPDNGRTYASEETLDLSLPQARELLRLLRKMIPITEQSRAAAAVVVLDSQREAQP